MTQQRRRLTHMLGESGSSRGTVSSLKAQNERLKSDIKELHAKIQAGDRRCSVCKTFISQFLYASNCLLYLQELQLNLERMRKLNYKLKQKSLELEKARQPASPVPSLDLSQSHSDLITVDEESHCSILQEELEQVRTYYTLILHHASKDTAAVEEWSGKLDFLMDFCNPLFNNPLFNSNVWQLTDLSDLFLHLILCTQNTSSVILLAVIVVQVTFDYAEMETNYGMLKREKLQLEKENDCLKQQLLRGEYDTQREDAKMKQLQHERDEALGKLQKMEEDLLSIVDSDETEGSAKEVQKRSTKEERGTSKWHELEAKLVQTEESLAATQEKVTEFTQREEQFLQQLQDVSGELEHSREQHRAEITNLREELNKQELHNTTAEDVESKIIKLQQELQQRTQENEAILQQKRDEMEAKEQQHLAEVIKLKEAMKTADNDRESSMEAFRLKVYMCHISCTLQSIHQYIFL